MPRGALAVRVRAFAKINLTLRVLGVRADGYHELRTTFQSLALHDTLTFTVARGPFQIACDDPACPVDRTNLVWRAADEIWRAAGRRGEPSGVRARIEKRIPLAAGLGGGSSDAAASLRALASLWGVELDDDGQRRIAAGLGADVPYFLQGGTALGVERGDVLFPLIDWPASWVVLLLPGFGVSTVEAYRWFDREGAGVTAAARRGNDLEAPVAARHPEIGELVEALRGAGASYGAMSGSGSAVFGLFDDRESAESAAGQLKDATRRAFVTRTLTRAEHQRLGRPLY
jgi:4-diphosphocytidyl-2-C-methyl-D-erythritol kinase